MISILRQRFVKHALQNILRIRNRIKPNAERNIYYFGYGANLMMERFTRRKMNVEEIGNGYLEDHELRFTLSNEYLQKGYAGVHEKKSSKVWGVLYRMDRLSLFLLDTLEWSGFGAYIRKLVEVKTSAGETIQAWCYFVKYPREGLMPSENYLQSMIRAGQQRRFPNEYIDYLRSHESRSNFPIDHTFSLLFYGKKRAFSKQLRLFYQLHDKIREKLCDLI